MNEDKMKKMYGNVIWTDKPHNFLGLKFNFTRYILTDKKLIERKGFLNIKEEKVDLYKIMDTSLDLPLGQRIFGCGTIKIMSKDISNPTINLSKIKDPYLVQNMLEATMDTQKKEYGILGKDIYAAPNHIHHDIHDCNNPDCEDNTCPDCNDKK